MTQEITFTTISSGEKKRSHNIEVIKKMLSKGLTYEQIWQQARLYLSPKTFNEYFIIASMSVEVKIENE